MHLVGDIGGTNARFAISSGPGSLLQVAAHKALDHPSFSAALKAYLETLPASDRAALRTVRLAAAGPIDAVAGRVELTNSPWTISAAEVSDLTGGARVELFNDLQAVALALPHLSASQTSPLGPAIIDPLPGNRIAVNVGTGFGASVAVVLGAGRWTALACEPGHMSFAAASEPEQALLSECGSIEDALSGYGLVDLERHFASVMSRAAAASEPIRCHDNQQVHPAEVATPEPTRCHDKQDSEETVRFNLKQNRSRSARDVLASAQGPDGDETASAAAVAAFADILARVCGDLVLATGSWGGVYLTGSVAKAWAAGANAARFRQIFQAKGKMADRMARVPTSVISRPEPALFGLTFPDGAGSDEAVPDRAWLSTKRAPPA